MELSELGVVYFDGRHGAYSPLSQSAPIYPERRA
jgi:hypothetical protein